MEQTGGVGTAGADDEWNTDGRKIWPDSIKVGCISAQILNFRGQNQEPLWDTNGC
jgi:hypothetical protein